mgnify:CR=1 FL=1
MYLRITHPEDFLQSQNPHLTFFFILSKINRIQNVIPGSKGQKFDASLLAGEFLTLGPAKNMSKQPFFKEK